MPNYKNGKIYKLCSLISDKVYIGSTSQPLCKRFGDHKSMAKKRQETPVYKHINQIGWENYNIILIENFPCNNKEELEKQERYYIEKLHSQLNYMIPTRTKKEYNEKNKDKIKHHKKEYYEDNKLIINKKCKSYNEQNKDKIHTIHKLYNETHKQEIKHYKKQYYQAHKEKISFKKSINYYKRNFKNLMTDFDNIKKEHDNLFTKFNLIH